MTAERTLPEITEDAVLGGRLRFRQPRSGHRIGHDAILLAAATAAQAGEHAIDLGAGVGAAGIAVAARIPGLKVTLAEIDPALCALARENAKLNRLDDRVTAVALDVTDAAAFEAAGIKAGSVQRVLMNPPFHDAARHNISPDPARRRAHAADAGTLAAWLNAAERLLGDGGVLTLIWRADELENVLAALGGFGGVRVLPVLPRAGATAIRVLVRAGKGSDAPPKTYPALCLNDAGGKPTAEAEAVLRHSETLPLAAD